ncbi:MAG: TetR family transcriptional regulator [Burkholderiales bacterium PBB6]|nr:MAG: TetR family transcriptional regulator [Burkholderiales bacterium PBB6]
MNEPVQKAGKAAAQIATAAVKVPARRGRPPKVAVPENEAEPGRTNDPERTMADILAVATSEFAAKGLAGARIDEIAALTRTSKRMIYYYFESKEGLYIAVLEDAYSRIRRIEAALHLEDLPPEEALRTLVGFTFDYQLANPDFIRLVMNENMHKGEFISRSSTIIALNVPIITAVQQVYERGVAAGVFRPDVDAVDLHMSISALSFFNVANRHTFGAIFKRTLDTPEAVAARRASVVDMVVRFLRA